MSQARGLGLRFEDAREELLEVLVAQSERIGVPEFERTRIESVFPGQDRQQRRDCPQS